MPVDLRPDNLYNSQGDGLAWNGYIKKDDIQYLSVAQSTVSESSDALKKTMRILFFFGTRPEAIKLSPLIKEFKRYPEKFDVKVCVSAQHREMLDQVLKFFCIKSDFDLNIMERNQNLFDITTKALNAVRNIISSCKPDWLVVQGDTTSTFAGALAAFYEKVKVAHIEAGLRSFNKYSPFPEEVNRVLTTRLSDIHFAPTETARNNLLNESIPHNIIFVVGNTSIDSLCLCLKKISRAKPEKSERLKGINLNRKIILVTGHRRESFGKPFKNICHALKEIARDKRLEIVYPVHLNPNVRKSVFKILHDIPNIHLLDPLDYPLFVWLMKRSYIILTDSGGVQEEAPSLGKPVLVMRDVTERTEGIEAGTARIVGTNRDRIFEETQKLLRDRGEYEKMENAVNPYGDGKSSEKIVNIFRGL